MKNIAISAFIVLTIAAAAQGSAVLPIEGTTLNQIHMQFQWPPVDSIDSYELWVVEDDQSADPFASALPVVDMVLDPAHPGAVVTTGLQFGMPYAWRVRGVSGAPLPWGSTHRFSIAPLPDHLPEMAVTMAAGSARLEPGVTLFNITFSGDDLPFPDGLAVAVTADGEPVWFLTHPARLGEIRLLDNGRILMRAGRRGYEVYLDGRVRVATPEGIDVHHDVFPMPNGNILSLTNSQQEVLRDGILETWKGDVIVEFDRHSEVVWQWDTFDHFSTLDYDETEMQEADPDGTYDWTHSNAITYLPSENSVYLSVRHLSRITRIDYATGDIVFNMGFTSPSGEVDFGDNLFSFQHAHEHQPNGNLLLFDNGNRRDHIVQDASTGMSKAVELAFTGSPPTSASIVWEWTLPTYQSSRSDADRLPGGNTLVTAAPIAEFYEVDPAANELWRLTVVPGKFATASYRAQRVAQLVIEDPCPYDVVEPAGVDVLDLLEMLTTWGTVGVPCDFLPPAGVGVEDLLELLNFWAGCSS